MASRKRLARREQFLLPDEFVEQPRPHALGQRSGGLACGCVFVGKQRIHVFKKPGRKA